MIILIYTGVSDFFFHGLYFQCLIEEGQSQKGTYFANQLHKTLSYAKTKQSIAQGHIQN